MSESLERVEPSWETAGCWGALGAGAGFLAEGGLNAALAGASVRGIPNELLAERARGNEGTRASFPGVDVGAVGGEPGIAGVGPLERIPSI